MTPRALTLAEVAARLGVSASTVSRYVADGRLKRIPKMRLVRVTEDALAAFMGQKPVDSANDWDATLNDAHAV